MRLASGIFAATLTLLLAFAAQLDAREINWQKAAQTRITLFYPGVASWEFLTSDDHRLGGREIKQSRKDCRHCHMGKDGELDLKADDIAAGTVKMKRSHNPFEPEPAPGKKGTMTARLQAAYDSEFLYIRVEWDSKGAGWLKGKGAKGASDRVSLQINESEISFRKYGCFITCHNDLNTMPSAPSKKEVGSNHYYSALGRDDVRLYAYYTRDAWSIRKGEKELDRKLKDGGRIDLVSVELEDGAAKAQDGWVFDDRRWEEKDISGAEGQWASGKYSVVFRKSLKSKDPFDVEIAEGDAVSVGMAIHEDGASKRKHYVSFPFSVGIGADADIKAEKISN